MRLFDWFRSATRQGEPQGEWWVALRRLQSDMDQLQLDWEKTYGKVRLALASLAKRQQRESGKLESDGEPSANGREQLAPDSDAYAKLRTMYGRR